MKNTNKYFPMLCLRYCAVIFIVLIGLSMAACNNDPDDDYYSLDDIIDEWLYDGAENKRVIIETPPFALFTFYDDPSVNTFTLTGITFTKKTNSDPATKAEYPAGYEISGSVAHADGSFIGTAPTTVSVFINKAREQIIYNGERYNRIE